MKFANYYKCSGYVLVTRHYASEYTKMFLALKMSYSITVHA